MKGSRIFLILGLICLLLCLQHQTFAQEEDPYFIKGNTWEEGVRLSCDQLIYDWNHNEGQFKFIYLYQQSWDTFNTAVRSTLYRHLNVIENQDERKILQGEIDDGIWETDRKSGDYKPLAIKMAWKIEQEFREKALQIAHAGDSWEDFIEVRKLYQLDKSLTLKLEQLNREFNEGNLLKGLEYLREVNDWSDKELAPILKKISTFKQQKGELISRCINGDLEVLADLDLFLSTTNEYLADVFVRRNKLFGSDSLLFLKRFPFQSNHYYTDYINGCKFYGGNLYSLNLKTGEERELVPELQNGIFNRMDLDFDAGKIVFDWKEEQQSGFRIYEKDLITNELRQITVPPDNEDQLIELYRVTPEYHHGTDDMHPIYLPDGGICFISTRCQYGILCDGPDNFSTTILYRMDADGQNIEKLTNSALSESNPSVMEDGRILYTRWEYIDKGAVAVKCLWAMRPDGTNPVEIYGNTIDLPPALLMGRQIPGHSNLFSCLGTPHCCPENGIGTVITINTQLDIRTREPMGYVTPNTDIRSENGVSQFIKGEWETTHSGPVYCDPFPLSEKQFLVAHNPSSYFNEKTAWGLYYIDVFGNHIRIFDDPEISCWQPMPYTSRKRPNVVQSVIDPNLKEKGLAAVLVTNVAHGMEGVNVEDVKYIRVNEQIPRPWKARKNWPGEVYDQQHAVVSKDTHLGLKLQHGIIPVEPDGSAYFLVKADRNIFFQVLDENFMELQRERTYNNFRPGEIRSCSGCHERRTEAAFSTGKRPLAFDKAPRLPGPQPGEKSGLRPLDYVADVQPIWNKSCIECHSGDNPKGGLNLSGDLTTFFNVSYENLVPERRQNPKDPNYLGWIIGENHPKEQNAHYLPAKSLGSHTSRLMKMMNQGHQGIELTKEELVRISTWIDSNAQYYGTYYGKKNLMYKNDPDFRPVATVESALDR